MSNIVCDMQVDSTVSLSVPADNNRNNNAQERVRVQMTQLQIAQKAIDHDSTYPMAFVTTGFALLSAQEHKRIELRQREAASGNASKNLPPPPLPRVRDPLIFPTDAAAAAAHVADTAAHVADSGEEKYGFLSATQLCVRAIESWYI